VGAIANEAGIENKYIGKVKLFDKHSTVELPDGMPKDVYRHLKRVWVCGQQLKISKMGGAETRSKRANQSRKTKQKKDRWSNLFSGFCGPKRQESSSERSVRWIWRTCPWPRPLSG
ncbi:MAG: DbpA RNA binding domain-containing protein, partial [Deltaproteobacteria bacterium]